MNISKKVKELEGIVQGLEGEEVDLDKALKDYTKATGIVKEVFEFLKKTETKINVLKDEV